MISYWEQQSFTNSHLIVIGSGITGLSSAISFKQRYPDKEVLVLERGILPTGASTKNAGFACVGSVAELSADLETMSPDEVATLVEARQQGLQLMRERLGDAQIDYRTEGSHELLYRSELGLLDRIDGLNQLLSPVFGRNIYQDATSNLHGFGFKQGSFSAAISNSAEGSIDTGKMMRALIALASELGVRIHTGAEVMSYEETNGSVSLQVKDPIGTDAIQFKTETLFICTNAWAKDLIKNEEVRPGRGLVLCTKPIKNLSFKGIFHFDQGFYYFRNHLGRIIFGGGRNIDIGTEETHEFEVNQLIFRDLMTKLQESLVQGQKIELENFWAGIMAFGPNKQPLLQRLGKRTYAGVRLNGMGVALGHSLGNELVNLYERDSVPRPIP